MIVLTTLGHRWFAFVFVAVLVWSAWPEGGYRRALRFLAVAFGVSLAGEYASTHWGFPYGRYDYIANSAGEELYISNIPLFVPIAYGTLVWGGRSLAAGTRTAGSLPGLAFTTAVFAVLLDMVVDPMTLRGSKWFLGDLYRYHAGGPWFGIPWSNFGGWFLVSSMIVTLDGRGGRDPVASAASARKGRILAFGTCGFFIVLALATREWRIAGAAAAVTLLVAALTRPGRG